MTMWRRGSGEGYLLTRESERRQRGEGMSWKVNKSVLNLYIFMEVVEDQITTYIYGTSPSWKRWKGATSMGNGREEESRTFELKDGILERVIEAGRPAELKVLLVGVGGGFVDSDGGGGVGIGLALSSVSAQYQPPSDVGDHQPPQRPPPPAGAYSPGSTYALGGIRLTDPTSWARTVSV
ncbi:hypothetical protein R3P38DRAFT_2802323 [Favolaschia claudopus]|uniref:Uncharacterized protein n=1 Tax=Favolaschia claudopus TaxID=2862362 RepID=A0AAV9ZUK8_9AGAR